VSALDYVMQFLESLSKPPTPAAAPASPSGSSLDLQSVSGNTVTEADLDREARLLVEAIPQLGGDLEQLCEQLGKEKRQQEEKGYNRDGDKSRD
jgi:hypothetical protein